tara:strand:+ start:2521 stop:3366 length:846 start_codon:yes stop_codon:yes gene_type:complete
MAFKFKVKKRPSMGQAVASAFAAGAIQGGATALQNAMKEREERKNNSTKELNSFNSVISGLPSTPENLSKIIPIKADIATGKITASTGLDILGYDLDYQTEKQKNAEIKAREEALEPMIESAERGAMAARKDIGLGTQPTKMEKDVRTREAQKRLGLRGEATPPSTIEQQQLKNLQRSLIEQANIAGMTFDQYLDNNVTNVDVKLYKEMTGTQPVQDDGMRLTDTARTGSRSIMQPQFNTTQAESTSQPTSTMQQFEGMRGVNPSTGEVVIFRDGRWQLTN